MEKMNRWVLCREVGCVCVPGDLLYPDCQNNPVLGLCEWIQPYSSQKPPVIPIVL
jgi:hypothetical protein